MLKMLESGVQQVSRQSVFLNLTDLMALQVALKEMSGYWKGAVDWKVALKFARTMGGAQCVIMGGAKPMPQSCVDNLIYQ